MKTACAEPGLLKGCIKAPASKSHGHRALIAACLCDRETKLLCENTSQDIIATMRCLEALGAEFEMKEGSISVSPIRKNSLEGSPLLDCGESGSTLRFLLPLAASRRVAVRFTGSGRLPERPIADLCRSLSRRGAFFSGESLPFSVSGPINPGCFLLPGGVSSQYVSGLLFALVLLLGQSEIQLTTPLQSAGYVDITIDVLKRFGIKTEKDGLRLIRVVGGQRYESPGVFGIEGDWSGAAFFMCSGALGGDITIAGLERDSLQGDREICSILERMGAGVEWLQDAVRVTGDGLRGTDIDAGDVPDLVPVLSVAAAAAKGRSVFYNAGRLRTKESDRLEATADMINALGGRAYTETDRLIVEGSESLIGGSVDSRGDHRIAMSAAVAAAICQTGVKISEPDCVSKSYPSFYKHYRELGGVVNGISLG